MAILRTDVQVAITAVQFHPAFLPASASAVAPARGPTAAGHIACTPVLACLHSALLQLVWLHLGASLFNCWHNSFPVLVVYHLWTLLLSAGSRDDLCNGKGNDILRA